MTDLREPQIYDRKIPPTGKISYGDFLDWLDEDTLAEWVDGEIIMTSPANYQHQSINGFLQPILKIYAEMYDLGEVISAPFQMKLPDSDSPGREPDLLFVAKANLAKFQKTFLEGAADLVIEIVSPESIERDYNTKLVEYQAGKVSEYWLIDPLQQQTKFYRLDDQNQYREIALDNAGRYYSHVLPGFWLDPQWLWRDPLPSTNTTLLRIDKAGYKAYLSKEENNLD